MSVDALFKQANAAQRAGARTKAERRYRKLARLKPLWAHHDLGVVYPTAHGIPPRGCFGGRSPANGRR